MNAIVPASTSSVASPFSHAHYTIKRPFLAFLGRKFHVYDASGNVVLFVRHKIFSLKDEWSVYSDESESQALLRVKARQMIGIDITTDIFDAKTNEKVGAVKNKGLKSIIRDTWELLDKNDQPLGTFAEDSSALLRRFVPILLGHWHADVGGTSVGKLDQVFRFFTKEFTLTVTPNAKADPRLIVGCAMLALMREIARESQN